MKITKSALKTLIQESVQKQLSEQSWEDNVDPVEHKFWEEEGFGKADNLINFVLNELAELPEHPFIEALNEFSRTQSEESRRIALRKREDFIRTLSYLADSVKEAEISKM